MLQIICPHCGGIHKGKDVNIQTAKVTKNGVSYKECIALCKHCGKDLQWDRCAQKTAENLEKALQKIAKKLVAKTVSKSTPTPTVEVSKPKYKKQGTMSDESLKLICAAMIGRATVDGGTKKYKKDVREFFNSQWGKDICEGLETTMKICDKIDKRVAPNEILKSIDEGKVNIAYIKLINGGKQ